MTDPIADMLTRIRNANAVRKTDVIIPYSKAKAAIAEVMKAAGYISDYDVDSEKKPSLRVRLNESGGGRMITEVHRVSKPGRRVYVPATEIPRVLNGRGLAIISTSNGIMSDRQARHKGIGGELMCKVW